MIQEGESISAGAGFNISKHALVTIIICTALSLLFIRAGFLSLFYFAPLGYAVIISGSFWLTFIVAASANIFFSIVLNFNFSGNHSLFMEIVYFSAMLLGFLWIMGAKSIRTIYRFILASAAGAVAFLLVLNRMDSFFYSMFNHLVEDFSLNIASIELLDIVKSIFLRGGAFISVSMMFLVNRQIALSAVWVIKRQRNYPPLTAFFAPQNTIWILSGALASILLTRLFRFEILEIMAWNVFVICVMIFLAQGAGVLLYLLSRRTAASRMIVFVVIIVVLLSPLSLAAVIALLALGIAENWRKFRVQQ
jgi:hypothetical protein